MRAARTRNRRRVANTKGRRRRPPDLRPPARRCRFSSPDRFRRARGRRRARGLEKRRAAARACQAARMSWIDAELVLISLAAMLSPTTLSFSIFALVLGERPLRTGTWFYLGAFGATLAVGVAA